MPAAIPADDAPIPDTSPSSPPGFAPGKFVPEKERSGNKRRPPNADFASQKKASHHESSIVEDLWPKPQAAAGPGLLSEDQRQAVLAAADHHNFGIRTLSQIFRGFNAFPFQQLRADALGDNLLEIADARSFDPLTLGFLLFFLQAKLMASDSCSACCFDSMEALSVAGSWISRSRTLSTMKPRCPRRLESSSKICLATISRSPV